jgi:very-short-patch-repair endonuclease
MDIDEMVRASTLDATFPLPPDRPFTRAAALAAGVSRRVLDTLVEEGLVRRAVKGVYVGTHVADSVALRAECLRLVVPPDCVVVDRHAGWLHGAQMILAPGEHLELRPLSLFLPSGRGRLRNKLAASGERLLRPDDVMEVDGLRVTTPLRTAWDLGRVRWTDEAISGLDAMFRLGGFGREEFLAGIERFRRMRWITTLRAIGPHADGRSESPGESVLRLRCFECGVRVEPQHEVCRGGQVIARLDLADPVLRTGFEYDGAEWHSSPDQLTHDRERRRAVIEEGWDVRAFRAADVFGRQRACEEVIQQVTRDARAQRRLRRAG